MCSINWRSEVVRLINNLKTVLVVDDVPDNQALMVALVKSFGYSVVTADNGREGIAKFTEFHPDLILMDIMMPVMDGIEATKIIRTSDLEQVPIIALTAFHDNYHREALEAGCNGVIPKPINFDDLRSVLDQYLQNKS